VRRAVASIVFFGALACGQADSAPSASGGRPTRDDRRVPVARLASKQGDVRYQSAAAGTWTPAHRGEPLHPRDAVQTMDGAAATIRFRSGDAPGEPHSPSDEGPLARLGPLTTLHIPEQAPAVARLRQMSGHLVARLSEHDLQRLEVELPAGTLVLEPAANVSSGSGAVEARVEVSDESTGITMVEGTARLERARGDPLRLRQHHFVELAPSGEVTRSGRLGAQAEPISPADGATVRTRRDTRFAWAKIPGAQAARLRIRPDAGETREVDLPRDASEVAVALESGHYTWSVVGIVDGEPLPSAPERSLIVDLDRTPPRLSLDSPAPGTSVSGGAVRVAGRTEAGAKLSVQGLEIDAGPDGSFSAMIPVPRGLTNVVVSAVDDLGNSRVVSRAVLRE